MSEMNVTHEDGERFTVQSRHEEDTQQLLDFVRHYFQLVEEEK